MIGRRRPGVKLSEPVTPRRQVVGELLPPARCRKKKVIRIRCFDPEFDDQSIVDWRLSALIIATLLLDFPFWFAHCVAACHSR
jgi:hypothetical protein